MKTPLALILALALVAGAHAAAIPLFNTGVNASHVALPGGSADPHYDVLSTGLDAVVVTNLAGSWLPNTATSQWIWQNATALPAGTFTFRTTFDMTGLDLLSAIISGRWSTDNIGTNILINGAPTGQTSSGFTAWTNFSILNTSLVAGINTLDFVVTDQGSPGAFRAEFLTATANPVSTQPPGVPDSGSTLVLLGASVLAMCFGRKRASGRH